MANIRVYEAPNLGLQPNERASDALAQAARTTGALYNQAASFTRQLGDEVVSTGKMIGDAAEDYVAFREVSTGGAAYASMHENINKAWDTTLKNSDANDPTVAARFHEQVVTPVLEQFGSGFITKRGREWALQRTQSFDHHMRVKQAADMSTMAGIAARTNLEQSVNSFSNAVRDDPSGLDVAIEAYKSQVGALTGSRNLDAEAQARLRGAATQKGIEQIVLSAVSGAIMKNPEAGIRLASDPRYSKYISGADVKRLESEAKMHARAAREDMRWAEYLKKQERERESDTAEGNYMQRLYSDNPAEVSAKAVTSDHVLSREAKTRLIGLIEREQKDPTPAHVSRATTADLLSRLRLPEGSQYRLNSVGPIYDAMIAGKLTRADFGFLQKEFKDMRTPEGERLSAASSTFIRDYRAMIERPDPATGLASVDAKERAYFFETDTIRMIHEYRQQGRNPYDLFNPSHPDFLGKPERIYLVHFLIQVRIILIHKNAGSFIINFP